MYAGLHTCCTRQSRRARRILRSPSFNVLRKILWGEITEAWSPPFVTDEKPFSKGLGCPGLVLLPISFKAPVSVICLLHSRRRWGRLGSPFTGAVMKFRHYDPPLSPLSGDRTTQRRLLKRTRSGLVTSISLIQG